MCTASAVCLRERLADDYHLRAEEVRMQHKDLYPEDGEVYCLRLMSVHQDKAFAVSTKATLGGKTTLYLPCSYTFRV